MHSFNYSTSMTHVQERGCSSNGRALALHARGTGIDTRRLQGPSFFPLQKISLLIEIGAQKPQRDLFSPPFSTPFDWHFCL